MKIRFDIDCTAQEARELLGLPDLEPIQQEMLDEVEALLKKQIALLDGETVMKNWLGGWQDIQKLWSSALVAPTTSRTDEEDERSGAT